MKLNDEFIRQFVTSGVEMEFVGISGERQSGYHGPRHRAARGLRDALPRRAVGPAGHAHRGPANAVEGQLHEGDHVAAGAGGASPPGSIFWDLQDMRASVPLQTQFVFANFDALFEKMLTKFYQHAI